MKIIANTVGFTDKKKLNLVSELMVAGAATTIIGGSLIVAACIVMFQSQAWYRAGNNETMDSIGKLWTSLEEGVTKNG